MSRRSPNSRLYAVFLFFMLAFVLLIARLCYLQMFKSSQLKALAGEQHHTFTEIEPLKGIIFDRRMKELALNSVSYSIYATREFSAGPSAVAGESEKVAELAALLGLQLEALAAKIKAEKNFIWLKRQVAPDVYAKISALNIPGVGQLRECKRFYPEGHLASHIIGFTDIDNRGLEGAEFYFDSYLSGVKGWRLAQQDARQREVICWGYKSIQPSDGYNLVLTIDSVIQNIAERQLRRAARKYRATSATAIVMEPKTGEILALCNYPDYDLNRAQDYAAGVRRNLAITDIFEPGSSFKFVTAAAAIAEQRVALEDKFFCEQGRFRIGGRILHDYRPHAELSFQEVLEHSSNIGIVKVAQLLGNKLIYRYIKAFGFGSLTGIHLPGEVKGIIRTPDKWSRASIAAVPMGQEIAVTALQLITAISAVANDGVLLQPKIVKSILRKDGRVIKEFPRQKVRRVISAQTAALLKQILIGCVENGTGKGAKLPGYKTAGKTGTAQKASPQGGYYKNKYIASFVGFVPADQPRLAILVVLNEPHPEYFGGRVCAPAFKKIASESLGYLEMSETDETARAN